MKQRQNIRVVGEFDVLLLPKVNKLVFTQTNHAETLNKTKDASNMSKKYQEIIIVLIQNVHQIFFHFIFEENPLLPFQNIPE